MQNADHEHDDLRPEYDLSQLKGRVVGKYREPSRSGTNLMIDQATIERAVSLLLEAAPPGSDVILFGSYARGDARPDSDLDFLVVEPQLEDRRQEMVRLRNVLRPMRIPADVLVTSHHVFQEWFDTPGTLLYEAAKEGKVFHAVPTARANSDE